jgi:hypothetical protein
MSGFAPVRGDKRASKCLLQQPILSVRAVVRLHRHRKELATKLRSNFALKRRSNPHISGPQDGRRDADKAGYFD